MNVVFLDVDGELTYSAYSNQHTADIDIDKVKLLKEICDRGNASVVISSSWRGSKNYTPRIYYILLDILENNGIDVIGDLPYIESHIFSSSESDSYSMLHGTGRAAEVEKWLSENKTDNFVILDDEDWDWKDYGFADNWVQPTWHGDGGLKREHVEAAVRILNGDK